MAVLEPSVVLVVGTEGGLEDHLEVDLGGVPGLDGVFLHGAAQKAPTHKRSVARSGDAWPSAAGGLAPRTFDGLTKDVK